MQDRIEKRVVLKAPRARVWRAINDKTEFGTWFGCKFAPGQFKPGEKVHGQITYPGYEHFSIDVEVVEVEPERKLSYRWHPGKPGGDYSAEPPTLVTFTLSDAKDGTLLEIVESGFEKLPLHRRAEAFKSNEGGWEEQTRRIAKHVGSSS